MKRQLAHASLTNINPLLSWSKRTALNRILRKLSHTCHFSSLTERYRKNGANSSTSSGESSDCCSMTCQLTEARASKWNAVRYWRSTVDLRVSVQSRSVRLARRAKIADRTAHTLVVGQAAPQYRRGIRRLMTFQCRAASHRRHS